jgi:hypothetical protein
LTFVDANGALIAPVVVVENDAQTARIALDVAGRLAIVLAHRTAFEGVTDLEVYYATTDCSDQGFIRSDPIGLVPRAVVVGAQGSPQTLYVADENSAPQAFTVQGRRSSKFNGCDSSSQFDSDNLYPAIGGLDLSAIGQRPFRLIKSQD